MILLHIGPTSKGGRVQVGGEEDTRKFVRVEYSYFIS